jgi:hypothetical protein
MPDGGQQVTGTGVSVLMYQHQTAVIVPVNLAMVSQYDVLRINIIGLPSGLFTRYYFLT